MLLKDTPKSFGTVSIALHWITAVSVLTLLGTGVISLYYIWFLTGERGGIGWFNMNLHVVVGSLAIPFIALRVYWRVRQGHPQEPKQPPVLEKITAINWPLMLVFIVGCFVSGVFLQLLHGNTLWWSVDRGAIVPAPWPRDVPELTDIHDHFMLPFHYWLALILGAVVAMHIAGALKHWIVNRDGVLERMLRPGELRTSLNATPDGPPAEPLGAKQRAGG